MGKKILTLLVCAIFSASMAVAQTRVVTGTVVDSETGDPIPGAKVMVQGTKMGAIADANGRFVLKDLPKDAKKVIVSFMGMKTADVTIHNGMKVILIPDTKAMDELVVLGYGNAKKLGSVVGAVSTVSNATLEKAVTPNFTDALAGQVSGLSVLSSDGDPTTNATIRLRGVNSINSSNAPLYILDGAPVSSSVFNTLNPADIQSITVLKDAASTAIYGSRAANGVIVITSRKGKFNERANFTVRAQAGFSSAVSDGIQVMNSQQYIQFRDLIGMPVSNDIRNLVDNYGISTNWRNEVINNCAPTYTFDGSVSGGSEHINYFISLNHHKQEGTIDNSGMHRTTVRANIEGRINRWFKLGAQVNLGSNTYQQNAEQQDNEGIYLTNPMVFARMAMPYDSPRYYTFDDYGNIVYGDRAQHLKYSGLNTPWWTNKNRSETQKRLTLNLNAFEQINPIEGLTIRAQQALDGYDYTYSYAKLPYESFTTPMGSTVRANTGLTQNSFTRYAAYTFTHTAEYARTVGDHSFNILLGEETIYKRSRGFSLYTTGQTDPRQVRLTDGTTVAMSNIEDARSEQSFNSIFMTGSYNYKEKYFADASYRADGSSIFAPGHRWGHFWSVGAMWDMKKESWLEKVKWLDILKIRASYGLTGNSSGPGSYDYIGTIDKGSLYNTQASLGIAKPSNNTLTWEKVGALNVGFTLGIFDRAILNVDIYKKKTTDMLMAIPYSYTTGFDSGMGNIGAMTNTGIDVDLNVKIIQTKDWSWTFKGNFNYNKNEITELFAGRDEYVIANTGIKMQVGKPYGEFYSVRYAGVDSRDGKQLWYDKNGNLTKVWNEEENSVFTGKQRYAPWSGGFGTSISWKGLSISADFAWQARKWMMNNDNYFLKNANLGTSYNQAVEMLNMWTQPGDITDIPAYGEAIQFDDHLIEDASFLRLKNLTVQYAFPKKWMTSRNGIKNAKIFFVGRNLFTATKFSGYDPEPDINIVQFNYPNSRQFVFGAELTF